MSKTKAKPSAKNEDVRIVESIIQAFTILHSHGWTGSFVLVTPTLHRFRHYTKPRIVLVKPTKPKKASRKRP